GEVVAAPRDGNDDFMDTLEELRREAQVSEGRRDQEANTTIGVVATNLKLSKEEANRLASLAHDGLARAILPVHTSSDGDAMFALSTGEREMPSEALTALEAFTSLVAERAVLKAIAAATSLGGVP